MSADPPASATVTAALEVKIASCDCCGMKDEYTLGYIEKICERYEGKWLCGLCAAAVDDVMERSEMTIGSDEALRRHLNVCQQFNASSLPPDPTGGLITAMKQILIKGLDSPKSPRSEASD